MSEHAQRRFAAVTRRWIATVALVLALGGRAGAQPEAVAPHDDAPPSAAPAAAAPAAPAPAPDAPPPSEPPATSVPSEPPVLESDSLRSSISGIQIHGFASEGGFVSTANDYLGPSSRGTLEFFEAAINLSTEVSDRLRVGVQLFGRDAGQFRDLPPRLDWAYLDYHWKPWLGVRAGVIKMPYGLYNEYADIDNSRLAILLPQSVYPYRNRSALLSHTGLSLYGAIDLDAGGELDYQAWLGTLTVPENALELSGGSLDSIDSKYVTGAQVFWQPPIDGLRLGATYVRFSLDFHITLDPALIDAVIMAGLAQPGYDGKLLVSQRPGSSSIGSIEYTRGDWIFAAEYARSFKRQRSSLPALVPTTESTSDSLYAMVTRRLTELVEVGGYYGVAFADVNDRDGHDKMVFPESYDAFQRDLAGTLRLDINDHWLWKVEGHFIDGTADLERSLNPHRDRYWGLFLFRTTVAF